MIIKKIDSHEASRYDSYVTVLIDYMVQPHKTKTKERVLYVACRGCTFDDVDVARVEMAAMADGAKTKVNPTLHLMISWREGEIPTQDDVDEAVKILMKELNLSGHSVVYALHLDTDNLHVHVAISRVHPETERVITPANGLYLEAIHIAVAKIEYAQGWESEEKSRYTVLDDGQLIRNGLARVKLKQPSTQRRDMEHRTGTKSVQRLAREQIGDVFANVKSWSELHQELAKRGMCYQRKGSGAVIVVGLTPVKASDVHDDASYIRLEKRLGVFQEAGKEHEANYQKNKFLTSMPQPLDQRTPQWEYYANNRKIYFSRVKHATQELNDEQNRIWTSLLHEQAAQRKQCLKGNWSHIGLAREAMRSVIAADHASNKLALKEKFKDEAVDLKRRMEPAWDDPYHLDYELWLRAKNSDANADKWRYHTHPACGFTPADRSDMDSDEFKDSVDIRAFKSEIVGGLAYYYKANDELMKMPSFIDKGRCIEVCDPNSDESILAAMQLAAQKYGKFVAIGGDDFKNRCVEIAAKHGLPLGNPELQKTLSAVREQIRLDRISAQEKSSSGAWKKYFEVMQAQTYCVSAAQMARNKVPSVQRMSLVTDKESGFSAEDIVVAQRRMLRGVRLLNTEGVSWSISPQYDDKVTLLAKDATASQLQAIQDSGLKPRLVLSTESGKFDVYLTAPKQCLEDIYTASNKCALAFSKKYGLKFEVCNASTFGHALLDTHGTERASTALHTAHARDCQVTSKALSHIDSVLSIKRKADMGNVAQEVDCVSAYRRHLDDLLKSSRGQRLHPSRIDSQICLRLKMSGHTREEVVESLISAKKGQVQSLDGMDWEFYANRATSFAWGPLGKHEEALNQVHISRWRRLEGRIDSAPGAF